MTYPDVPLGYLIEVAPGADVSTDPATWPWADETADLVTNLPIKHKRGGDDEEGDSSSESSLTFRNNTRRWSTDNPLSDLYPDWNVDCPIRCSLSLDGSSTWHELFTQFASEITDTWGGKSGRLPRTAVGMDGVFRRLSVGDTERSALDRTTSGFTVNGARPIALWSMQDGENATQFASSLPGGSPLRLQGPALAVDDSLIGSLPLPTFDGFAFAEASLPAYTDPGEWVAQIVIRPDSPSPGPWASVVSVETANGKVAGGVLPDTGQLVLAWWTDPEGSGPFTQVVDFFADIATVQNQWLTLILQSVQDPMGGADTVSVTVRDDRGVFLLSVSDTTAVGFHAAATAVNVSGNRNGVGMGGTYGHLGIWASTDFNLGTDDVAIARAMSGWAAEEAHDRIIRLLRELGIASNVTATRSTALGAQRPGRTLDLLRESEAADHGILDDSRGAVAYRALSEMFGQTPALVIDADEYELGFPLRPVTDDQKLVNRSTVTRVGGSSATVDRSNGAAVRLGDDPELNLYDDTQPAHHASWYVNLGTVKGKRVPQITINFRAAPQLAAAFLVLRLGDRVQIINAPQELAHSRTLDLIWVGWKTATVSRTTLTATANCAPYAPYNVLKYGSTTGTTTAKYGAKNSTLNASITASATSVVVASGGDVWATSASHPALFPAGGGPGINVTIGGLTYLCTAITGTGSPTYTFTIVRLAAADDRAHAAGTAVQVLPPKYGM